MPPRKSKTPEQLHEEELDKLSLPPISFLVKVIKKYGGDHGTEISTWKFVSLGSAEKAFLSLIPVLFEENIESKKSEPQEAEIELFRCDRGGEPVASLMKTYIREIKAEGVQGR